MPTQPTPVYEQLWLVVMVAILWYAVPRLKTDGMAILLYLGLYSFGRFFISFYRVNNILLFGLREAQLVALSCSSWWARRRSCCVVGPSDAPRPHRHRKWTDERVW